MLRVSGLVDLVGIIKEIVESDVVVICKVFQMCIQTRVTSEKVRHAFEYLHTRMIKDKLRMS
jgi:hypothetical protein